MPFLTVMQSYFRGERIESLGFILPFGVFCLAIAWAAVRAERNAFGWGFAVPVALIALVCVSVGAGVGLRTPGQIQRLSAQVQEDPKAFLAEEIPRMEQVNRNWPTYRVAWIAFVVIGAALRFVLRADWAHGAGIGLMFMGAGGIIIDGFAERRAMVYMEALRALSVQHGGAPSPAEGG